MRQSIAILLSSTDIAEKLLAILSDVELRTRLRVAGPVRRAPVRLAYQHSLLSGRDGRGDARQAAMKTLVLGAQGQDGRLLMHALRGPRP